MMVACCPARGVSECGHYDIKAVHRPFDGYG